MRSYNKEQVPYFTWGTDASHELFSLLDFGCRRVLGETGNKPPMDMNLSKLWEMVKDGGVWRAAGHGVAKNRTRLSGWTTAVTKSLLYSKNKWLQRLTGGKNDSNELISIHCHFTYHFALIIKIRLHSLRDGGVRHPRCLSSGRKRKD